MKPHTFTAEIVRHFLADPTTPAVVLQLRQHEAALDRRELSLGDVLYQSMCRWFNAQLKQASCPLADELIGMALERVNWRNVARALLRYYTLPVIVATPPANPRLTWKPAAWAGPVN